MPETQASRALPGILAEIVEAKTRALAGLRSRAGEIEDAARSAPAPRDFDAALRAGDRVVLIAECKRRSPGAGLIRPDLDPAALAASYDGGGAGAVSVLTDEPFFGGSLEDLRAVRAAVGVPVLRKDFTLHPLHVLEARAAGADAVLLIVRILDDARLAELHDLARSLGMGVLVEAHDGEEVDRALAVGARVVGVNNRDLATFSSDLHTTLALAGRVPPDVALVSESGIRSPADVERLAEGGVHAILVGEALLRDSDPGRAAERLSVISRRARV